MNERVEPSAQCHGLTFYPIPEFTDVEMAFGASEAAFFDRRSSAGVPECFRKAGMELFFQGGPLPKLDPRVDRTKALRAVTAWLRSWAPAHEAKEATVGYALWLWSTPSALDAADAVGRGGRR